MVQSGKCAQPLARNAKRSLIIKYVLTGIGIFLTLVACLALYYYQKAQQSADDVDEMCRIKPGTPVEVVVSLARSLHFNTVADPLSALGGAELEVYAEGSSERLKWTDEKLPEFKDGKMGVGKVVIAPFLRHYCEITFKDRVVVSTRKAVLD